MNESISDVPAHMDSTMCVSYSCNDQNWCSNQYSFAIPPQFPMDFHSGLSSIMSTKRLDCHYDGAAGFPASTSNCGDFSLQSLPFPKKLSVPILHFNDIQAIRNPIKRPFELTREEDFMITVSNKVVANQWKTNKKIVHQEQRPSQDKNQEAIEIPREKVPAKRSQKLSDKITALQKLVSPYGKTDTASVLEEAAISIKVLQDQIKTLFNKLSSSSSIEMTKHLQHQVERRTELRNKRMCLVPVSVAQSLMIRQECNRRLGSSSYAVPRNS